MGLVPVLERLESQHFVTWTASGGGMRLDPRVQTGHNLPVDWALLERRRQADLGRLDAMQRYAQTRYCRRAFILRYFGDPEARASCGACDRCLGTRNALAALESTRPARTRTRPRA
jgi:ATP-dependent DNA helicase RecQ